MYRAPGRLSSPTPQKRRSSNSYVSDNAPYHRFKLHQSGTMISIAKQAVGKIVSVWVSGDSLSIAFELQAVLSKRKRLSERL
jgi:hypothetical protein